MADPRDSLLKLLVKLARLPAGEPGGPLVRELKEAFLAYGSETDDNVSAVAALALIQTGRVRSLAIRGASVGVGDILNRLESMPIPQDIQMSFPELDQKKWEYSLRIVTLILSVFEPDR